MIFNENHGCRRAAALKRHQVQTSESMGFRWAEFCKTRRNFDENNGSRRVAAFKPHVVQTAGSMEFDFAEFCKTQGISMKTMVVEGFLHCKVPSSSDF